MIYLIKFILSREHDTSIVTNVVQAEYTMFMDLFKIVSMLYCLLVNKSRVNFKVDVSYFTSFSKG